MTDAAVRGGSSDPMSEEPLASYTWQHRGRDLFYLLGTSTIAMVLAAVVVGTLLFGGGTLLLLASPVILFTSPLWIPVLLTVLVVGGGLLLAFGASVAATYVASWMYQYMSNKHPPGADMVDKLKGRLFGTVGALQRQTWQYGHMVTDKTRAVGEQAWHVGENVSQRVMHTGQEMMQPVQQAGQRMMQPVQQLGARMMESGQQSYQYAQDVMAGSVQAGADMGRRAVGGAQEGVRQTGEYAQDVARQGVQKGQEMGHQAMQMGQDVARGGMQTAQDMGRQVMQKGQEIGGQAGKMGQEGMQQAGNGARVAKGGGGVGGGGVGGVEQVRVLEGAQKGLQDVQRVLEEEKRTVTRKG